VAARMTSILDVARATANAEGVALPLLLAVASAESGGRARARSDAGAVGLMQLLPGTAADMARAGGEPTPDLTDPTTSLRLGARYLAIQLRRFEGRAYSRDLALCAYNAGPSTVLGWLKTLPPELTARPPVEWVPWKEPRDYVRRVADWERRWSERLSAPPIDD
jgi:soluble lytic murein transglycosylase